MNLDHDKITESIKKAELNTSGEIQVVVSKLPVKDVYKKAVKVFEKIGLGQTKDHNAILFYIAELSHKFAILGDKGIHEKVHQEFWDEIRNEMVKHFKEEEFTKGLCEAIELCGEKLKVYFPYQEDDMNELADHVHVEE